LRLLVRLLPLLLLRALQQGRVFGYPVAQNALMIRTHMFLLLSVFEL
jgi:hypothetical protein